MKAPQTMDEVTEQLIAMGEIDPPSDEVPGRVLPQVRRDAALLAPGRRDAACKRRLLLRRRARRLQRAPQGGSDRHGIRARAEFERRNSQPLEGGREGLLDG